MEKTKEEKDTARSQAKAQMESIRELIRALETAREDGKAEIEGYMLDEDSIQERIQEDPLEVQIREDWHTPGADVEAGEYTILLCTGGPAVRIIGDLDKWKQPESARIEYQDWFTSWEEYRLDSDEEADILTYANHFYYGE